MTDVPCRATKESHQSCPRDGIALVTTGFSSSPKRLINHSVMSLRKPLRKEENGTSRGEYAMSSRCKQTAVETNNTGV
ncbi:proline-rich membrane anchor 1 [Tachysurus ichikawai]